MGEKLLGGIIVYFVIGLLIFGLGVYDDMVRDELHDIPKVPWYTYIGSFFLILLGWGPIFIWATSTVFIIDPIKDKIARRKRGRQS